MYYECFAGRSFGVSPQAIYEAMALPLRQGAPVLYMAVTILQVDAVSRQVFLGGVHTKSSSLVSFGGPTMVGISVCWYFTRSLPMLELVKHLQA